MRDSFINRLARRAAGEGHRLLDTAQARIDPRAALRGSSGEALLAEVFASRTLLERILHENIEPFWLPRVIDLADGGYHLHHDITGANLGVSSKTIIGQTRLLWYFARLARWTGEPAYFDAAEHGYAYLRSRMWDASCAGFLWEVAPDGEPLRANKHILAQTYGLFAVSEYALASGEQEVKRFASELFALIEERCRDAEYGGYQEFFTRDWSRVLNSGERYFGDDRTDKQFNTHLHVLEALSAYCRLDRGAAVRERMLELITILTSATVDKQYALGREFYRRDWTPMDDHRIHRRVSYGHDLERIWMLVEACELLEVPHALLLDLYGAMFDATVRYGWDRGAGGFFEWGQLGQRAYRRDKVWWVQAEALNCAATLYGLTRDARYGRCYLRTLEWIASHQVDWAHGDWFETVSPSGTAHGPKAGPWRDPYHQTRAVLAALDMTATLGGGSDGVVRPA